MKRLARYTLTLFAGVTIALMLTGCASTRIKQLSGTEFVDQADQIEQINSFHWTTYIGKTQQRAYLEYGHPAFLGSGTRTTIYWVPLSDLPEDLVQQLKAGNPPWKSWNVEK